MPRWRMTRRARDNGPSNYELLPRLDPTRLTIHMLRREVATLRELIETRMDAAAVATGDRFAYIERTVDLRVAALERWTALLGEQHDQIRGEVDKDVKLLRRGNRDVRGEIAGQVTSIGDVIAANRRSVQQEIDHQRDLRDEKFAGVERQFTERDIRNDRQVVVAQQAIETALDTARALADQQNAANAVAQQKSEASFTKQIDAMGLRIDTVQKVFDDRILEVKERIDRGEGSQLGARHVITEKRLDASQWIAIMAMIASVAFVILVAFGKH